MAGKLVSEGKEGCADVKKYLKIPAAVDREGPFEAMLWLTLLLSPGLHKVFTTFYVCDQTRA